MTTRASEASAAPLRRRPLDEAVTGARADDGAAAEDLLWYCRRIASRSLPAEEVADGSQALAELAIARIDATRGAASCWMYLLAAARTGVRRSLGHARAMPRRIDPPEQADLDRAIDAARLHERLAALVHRLPAGRRDVVERFYFRGESLAAIATALGSPIGTIKARLHVARQQLRVLLTDEGAT